MNRSTFLKGLFVLAGLALGGCTGGAEGPPPAGLSKAVFAVR